MTRETFGKALIKHQLIRFKLAEMARQIESLYALVEVTAFQFKAGVKDFSLGGLSLLLMLLLLLLLLWWWWLLLLLWLFVVALGTDQRA